MPATLWKRTLRNFGRLISVVLRRLPHRVDEGAQRGRHLPLLRIAQEQSRKRRGPLLQQRHQPAGRDVVGNGLLHREADADALRVARRAISLSSTISGPSTTTENQRPSSKNSQA